MKEPANTRRLLRGTAGAILLSAFAAFIVLQVTTRGENWRSLFQVDLSQLAFAGGLVGLSWILDAVRIQVLAAALGGRLGFLTALKITLAGAFAACVTPFDTGGEPLQVYLLHKQGFEPGKSTAIITLKSLISAVARLFLVLLIPTWYLIRRRAWALPKGLETALFIGELFRLRRTGKYHLICVLGQRTSSKEESPSLGSKDCRNSLDHSTLCFLSEQS
jgi:uncharacterized membrane protein YbhN (UPF0104 family)